MAAEMDGGGGAGVAAGDWRGGTGTALQNPDADAWEKRGVDRGERGW